MAEGEEVIARELVILVEGGEVSEVTKVVKRLIANNAFSGVS